MAILGLGKKNNFLGIDLGTTSLKLVEFTSERGVPKLITYGYAERAVADIAKDDSKVILDKVAALLKRLYKQCDIHSYRAVTALPNFSVFNSVITLPVMKKKELDAAIRWEAKKFVPLPIKDVILDWRIIDKIEISKKREIIVFF